MTSTVNFGPRQDVTHCI